MLFDESDIDVIVEVGDKRVRFDRLDSRVALESGVVMERRFREGRIKRYSDMADRKMELW